jgi:hypothetical protein
VINDFLKMKSSNASLFSFSFFFNQFKKGPFKGQHAVSFIPNYTFQSKGERERNAIAYTSARTTLQREELGGIAALVAGMGRTAASILDEEEEGMVG